MIFFYRCGSAPSQNEIDLRNNTGEVIEQQANTNVAVREVEEVRPQVAAQRKEVTAAREVANKAVKAAEEKREEKSGDVSYEQANKSRCVAYPSDFECQKER